MNPPSPSLARLMKEGFRLLAREPYLLFFPVTGFLIYNSLTFPFRLIDSNPFPITVMLADFTAFFFGLVNQTAMLMGIFAAFGGSSLSFVECFRRSWSFRGSLLLYTTILYFLRLALRLLVAPASFGIEFLYQILAFPITVGIGITAMLILPILAYENVPFRQSLRRVGSLLSNHLGAFLLGCTLFGLGLFPAVFFRSLIDIFGVQTISLFMHLVVSFYHGLIYFAVSMIGATYYVFVIEGTVPSAEEPGPSDEVWEIKR